MKAYQKEQRTTGRPCAWWKDQVYKDNIRKMGQEEEDTRDRETEREVVVGRWWS